MLSKELNIAKINLRDKVLFDEIKDELTRKICELKLWLANIDERNQYCNITKGLYFVYIYMGFTKKQYVR